MAALRNQRWETFCLCIVQGLTNKASYTAAGFTATGNAAETGASRLLRTAQIIERIRDLRAEVNEPAIAAMRLDAEFVTSRLMALADGKVIEGAEPIEHVPGSVRIAALTKLGEVLGIFKAPAVEDAETAARALAKQMSIPLEEARARIAEAQRFVREHV